MDGSYRKGIKSFVKIEDIHNCTIPLGITFKFLISLQIFTLIVKYFTSANNIVTFSKVEIDIIESIITSQFNTASIVYQDDKALKVGAMNFLIEEQQFLDRNNQAFHLVDLLQLNA
jgi:hypothetical protein